MFEKLKLWLAYLGSFLFTTMIVLGSVLIVGIIFTLTVMGLWFGVEGLFTTNEYQLWLGFELILTALLIFFTTQCFNWICEEISEKQRNRCKNKD